MHRAGKEGGSDVSIPLVVRCEIIYNAHKYNSRNSVPLDTFAPEVEVEGWLRQFGNSAYLARNE